MNAWTYYIIELEKGLNDLIYGFEQDLCTKALALMGVFLSAIYLKGHQLLSP